MEVSNKEEENAYRVKKKTFDLLPAAEENIAKLQVRGLHNADKCCRSCSTIQ